jgi:hypothetical protein
MHGSAPLDAVRKRAGFSPEKAVRRNATSTGAQASTSEKTAEAVGERVGDAYSDPKSAQRQKGNASLQAATSSRASSASGTVLATSRQIAQGVSQQFDEQPLMIMVACFALGYMSVLHGRR